MQRFRSNLLVLLSLTVLSVSASVFAEPKSQPEDLPLARLIVLPFKCDAGVNVRAQIHALILLELCKAGFEPLPDSMVEATLRRFRIRDTSRLTLKETQQLSRELGTPWICLGSVDLYTETEKNAEVGFSARLLNATNGEIVWAGMQFACGRDYAGMLNLGAITSAARLAELELHKIIQNFQRWWLEHPDRLYVLDPLISTAQRFLIIPFDNLTSTLPASQWINNALLSVLVERGYRLIEPGMVREHLQLSGSSIRGEIDLKTLETLTDEYPAAFLVAGALYQMSSESDATLGVIPSLEIGLRIMDNTGRLIWAQQLRRRGTDYVKIFHWGLIRTQGELLQAALRDLLDDFPLTLKHSGPQRDSSP